MVKMVCQGCGRIVAILDKHTHQDCQAWIKVLVKRQCAKSKEILKNMEIKDD